MFSQKIDYSEFDYVLNKMMFRNFMFGNDLKKINEKENNIKVYNTICLLGNFFNLDGILPPPTLKCFLMQIQKRRKLYSWNSLMKRIGKDFGKDYKQ